MRISDWSSDVCSSDLLYAGKIKGRNIGTEGRQRNIGEICDDAGRGLAKRNLPDTAQGNGGIFFASFGSSPETRGDRVDVGNGLNGTARGSVAKIVKLEHAWRRLEGRNDEGFQVAPIGRARG